MPISCICAFWFSRKLIVPWLSMLRTRRSAFPSGFSVHLQSCCQLFTAIYFRILRCLKSPVGFGGRKKVTAQSIVVGFYGVTNTARFVCFSFPAAIRSAMWTVDAAGAITVTDCFIVRYQTNVQQQIIQQGVTRQM